MAKRKNADTTLPPITGSFEDAVRALLATPPPPPGDKSTRKQAPTKRASAKKAKAAKR